MVNGGSKPPPLKIGAPMTVDHTQTIKNIHV